MLGPQRLLMACSSSPPAPTAAPVAIGATAYDDDNAVNPRRDVCGPSSGVSQIDGSRGRVLVVEDDGALRRALRGILARDHVVVLASSGAEAQAVLERDPQFDLVLCDLMMPEVSGIELHRWLHDRDPRLAERVLFLTGSVFTPEERAFLHGIGKECVEKPFDPGELLRIVAARVPRRQGSR